MHDGSQTAPETAAELLRVLPDPVIGCDPAGRITYWSPAAAEAYGFSADEAVGRPPALLLHTRLPRPALEIQEELHDLGCWQGHVVEHTKDGRALTVERRWVALRDDGDRGGSPGTVIVERPVTHPAQPAQPGEASPPPVAADGRPHDGPLRRAERLEALGQVVGAVAHDVNNALAIIANYAKYVSGEVRRLRSAPTDAQRTAIAQDLDEVCTAADRAVELTRQLLAFARLQDGGSRSIDLSACIRDNQQLLKRTVGSGIRIETRLDPRLRPVRADPDQIRQILINLAANARDAMPAGGTFVIETANVEAAGPHVRLQVSDTGTGMAPEVLERACEPFFTTKERGQGTGLGLSSVNGIVTQLGGRVELMSETGSGTTCVALLPAD